MIDMEECMQLIAREKAECPPGSKLWKVAPIQGRQLLDVNPEHLLNDGLYRKCDCKTAGGGYDHFPEIGEDLTGIRCRHQFVVQLYGCHLDCPYCYVTRDGVFGESVYVSSKSIIEAFKKSKMDVLHLMGGAPALYMSDWHDIKELVPDNKVFTSDLLLTECEYDKGVIDRLNRMYNSVYAVNIKGLTDEEYKANTGRDIDWGLFWRNMDKIMDSYLAFYFTFTNVEKGAALEAFRERISKDYGSYRLSRSFHIDIIQYKALQAPREVK